MKVDDAEAQAAQGDGEDDRRGEDAEGIVEDPERQTRPDEDLMDERAVAALHEAERRHDAGAAPQVGREAALTRKAVGESQLMTIATIPYL